jgi:RNA polymerase sigma-70 factor (ECF subfamily)
MFRFSTQNTDDLSDQELISRYRKNGDIKWIGKLYDRYAHLVYGICLKYLQSREESKDAVMQIFEKIIVELRTQEVINLKSWLYVVSRNFCLMEIRKRKRTMDISEAFENNEHLIMESTDDLHPIEEQLEDIKLKNCLEELSNEQKQCIELFYYKEKCYKEISEITKYDIKKVKSHMQNGKRNLKNCMEK